MPRVVLVPGLGLFGLGRSAKDARVAADLAEAAIETITDAEAIGRYQALDDANLFDMEYWSLEQAKLGSAAEKPLAGQIVAITGAGGGIGAATAQAFAAAGAEVALLDVNEAAATDKAKAIGGAALSLRCHRRGLGRGGLRPGRRDIRRARHPRVECGRDARQGKIGEVDEAVIAREFRTEFLRPPARRAGRREDHARARHRRLPAVQRVEAGDQSGPELRAVRTCRRPRRCSLSRQYALDYGAQTASAPTPSMPTASAPAS